MVTDNDTDIVMENNSAKGIATATAMDTDMDKDFKGFAVRRVRLYGAVVNSL